MSSHRKIAGIEISITDTVVSDNSLMIAQFLAALDSFYNVVGFRFPHNRPWGDLVHFLAQYGDREWPAMLGPTEWDAEQWNPGLMAEMVAVQEAAGEGEPDAAACKLADPDASDKPSFVKLVEMARLARLAAFKFEDDVTASWFEANGGAAAPLILYRAKTIVRDDSALRLSARETAATAARQIAVDSFRL